MTNHRTEAERWLGYAKDREVEQLPADEIHSAALIGIGHALLALTQQPENDALLSTLRDLKRRGQLP
jgi:hypothetical protein